MPAGQRSARGGQRGADSDLVGDSGGDGSGNLKYRLSNRRGMVGWHRGGQISIRAPTLSDAVFHIPATSTKLYGFDPQAVAEKLL